MQYLWDNIGLLESRIKKTGPLILFLDFDGTLSPLVLIPSQSKLPDSTKAVLEKLVKVDTLRIVIISGRALRDLKKKITIKGLIYVGNHGMEWEYNGKDFKADVSEKTLKTLQDIKKEMVEISRSFEGTVVEDKTFSIAMHYRALDHTEKSELETTLQKHFKKYLKTNNVSLLLDKDTFDLRANIGWTKGDLVNNLKTLLKSGNGKTIYLGDSKTDEDAFGKLYDDISIRVGFNKRSLAQYYLRDEKDVYKFLNWLLTQARRPSQ